MRRALHANRWRVVHKELLLLFAIRDLPCRTSFGDLLSQATRYGGFGLGTTNTSLLFLSAIVLLVFFASATAQRTAGITRKSKKLIFSSTFRRRYRLPAIHVKPEHTDKIITNLQRILSKAVIAFFILISALSFGHIASSGIRFTSAKVVESVKVSKLGDLSSFRTIAIDTSVRVNRGDFVAGKSRIKDLELAWDDAEPSLKPRSAAHWHTVDRALDRALSALRTVGPNADDCKHSLADLIATMDKISGKSA